MNPKQQHARHQYLTAIKNNRLTVEARFSRGDEVTLEDGKRVIFLEIKEYDGGYRHLVSYEDRTGRRPVRRYCSPNYFLAILKETA